LRPRLLSWRGRMGAWQLTLAALTVFILSFVASPFQMWKGAIALVVLGSLGLMRDARALTQLRQLRRDLSDGPERDLG
jgi:hypothetical protein